MNVMLTGATGFLGGNLLRMLCAEGHHVRYLSRGGKIAQADTGLADVSCVEGDLADYENLISACRGADWVIHAAAMVSSLEKDRSGMEKVNVAGTLSLLRASQCVKVRRFIFISSVDAVGIGSENVIANEDALYNNQCLRNPYSDTKHEAEKQLLSIQNSDTEIIIVNPAFMLGYWDTHQTSSRIVRQLHGECIFFAPNGGNCFVDVKDVCKGIIAAAEKGRNGQRYILGGHNLSYRDFFVRVASVIGRSAPVLVLPDRLVLFIAFCLEKLALAVHATPILTHNDAKFSILPHYFSSDKARNELGYSISPIEDAIRCALEWYRLPYKK
jgi:dihydroflavonol-4-reductase